MSDLSFQTFFLIFIRITSFLLVSPIFSLKGIPRMVKLGFSLILAFVIYTILPVEQGIYDENLLKYGILIIKETLFGLSLGFLVNLIFIGIQMAGQFIDFQIGFSSASYYDPIAGASISLYEKLYYWFSIALFFSIDGHHYLLYALAKSFEIIPLGSFIIKNISLIDVLDIFYNTFLTAFQIAVPIILILLLTDVVMGLLARTVPQLNVFILGLPLKVLVGLFVTIILLFPIGNLMIHVIETIPGRIEKSMQLQLIFFIKYSLPFIKI